MKILRLVPFLDFGGVEQRIKLTALGFQELVNVDLLIVVLGQGGKISEDLCGIGIRPLILNHSIKIPNLKLIYRLYRIIKTYHPDVVHCSGSEANFHGLIAAQMAGIRMKIGEEIGFPNHHFAWRLIFKLVYTCADKVIGISKAVAEKLIVLGEVPRSKVNVVYNPVELSQNIQYSRVSEMSAGFVFVTVCRLVPIKNLKFLLKSFHKLVMQTRSDTLKLNIVGEGSEKETLLKFCDELKLSEQVEFFGFQEDVSFFLNQADAFILPSFSEGFSISLVEAMLCSLPSIVTKIGGPSEIIEHGKTGFLIDPHRSEELIAAMMKVYSMNESERKLMGALAMQEGMRFSTMNYIKELIKVYSEH